MPKSDFSALRIVFQKVGDIGGTRFGRSCHFCFEAARARDCSGNARRALQRKARCRTLGRRAPKKQITFVERKFPWAFL